MSSALEPSFTSAKSKKKREKKVTHESLLLLTILVLVLLFVGSLLAINHPAASFLFPLRESSALGFN